VGVSFRHFTATCNVTVWLFWNLYTLARVRLGEWVFSWYPSAIYKRWDWNRLLLLTWLLGQAAFPAQAFSVRRTRALGYVLVNECSDVRQMDWLFICTVLRLFLPYIWCLSCCSNTASLYSDTFKLIWTHFIIIIVSQLQCTHWGWPILLKRTLEKYTYPHILWTKSTYSHFRDGAHIKVDDLYFPAF
jgi:hypothetical protein